MLCRGTAHGLARSVRLAAERLAGAQDDTAEQAAGAQRQAAAHAETHGEEVREQQAGRRVARISGRVDGTGRYPTLHPHSLRLLSHPIYYEPLTGRLPHGFTAPDRGR